MFILLLIIPLSVGILMMMIKRRTNPTRRTMTTREVTNHTRSPLVKVILIKNESPIMRAPTLIVIVKDQKRRSKEGEWVGANQNSLYRFGICPISNSTRLSSNMVETT
jgi:hypothetical protein